MLHCYAPPGEKDPLLWAQQKALAVEYEITRKESASVIAEQPRLQMQKIPEVASRSAPEPAPVTIERAESQKERKAFIEAKFSGDKHESSIGFLLKRYDLCPSQKKREEFVRNNSKLNPHLAAAIEILNSGTVSADDQQLLSAVKLVMEEAHKSAENPTQALIAESDRQAHVRERFGDAVLTAAEELKGNFFSGHRFAVLAKYSPKEVTDIAKAYRTLRDGVRG